MLVSGCVWFAVSPFGPGGEGQAETGLQERQRLSRGVGRGRVDPKGEFRTRDYALAELRRRAYVAIHESWATSDYTPRWSGHTEGVDAVMRYLWEFEPNLSLLELRKLSGRST